MQIKSSHLIPPPPQVNEYLFNSNHIPFSFMCTRLNFISQPVSITFQLPPLPVIYQESWKIAIPVFPFLSPPLFTGAFFFLFYLEFFYEGKALLNYLENTRNNRNGILGVFWKLNPASSFLNPASSFLERTKTQPTGPSTCSQQQAMSMRLTLTGGGGGRQGVLLCCELGVGP